MRIALVHDVFPGADGPARLVETLREAAAGGATLALLPELPLNPWSPATRKSDEADAEAPGGPRSRAQAEAARAAGIALIGGAIVCDPHARDKQRRNTALVFDAAGELRGRYAKLHLPDEPGFHEAHHYVPGDEPPTPIDLDGLRVGVQICSDANRPSGTQLLAARGAEVVLVPRATERATWARWRLVLRANALTGACYVLSANRPGPEAGVAIGGPSIAVDPDGEVLLESEARLTFCDLDPGRVRAARGAYPGYLLHLPEVYRQGWDDVIRRG